MNPQPIFFFLLFRGQLSSLCIIQAFQFSYSIAPPFFAVPAFIITFSKEETWNFKTQTSMTLLHTSTSHKITNKGMEDHSQMTIIHSPSVDNWKLAAVYQLILNQFILISQAHSLLQPLSHFSRVRLCATP